MCFVFVFTALCNVFLNQVLEHGGSKMRSVKLSILLHLLPLKIAQKYSSFLMTVQRHCYAGHYKFIFTVFGNRGPELIQQMSHTIH